MSKWGERYGGIARELIAFSTPLILSGVLQQLYNWVDAFIVGHVEGELAMGSVGATSTSVNLFVTASPASPWASPCSWRSATARVTTGRYPASSQPMPSYWAASSSSYPYPATFSRASFWNCWTRRRTCSRSRRSTCPSSSWDCRSWRYITSTLPPCARWATAARHS